MSQIGSLIYGINYPILIIIIIIIIIIMIYNAHSPP